MQMARRMAKETAKSLLARSARFSPKVSQRQSERRQEMSRIASAWQGLDAERAGWQALANVLNEREGRTGRQALSAYMAFTQVNSVRLASPDGLDILTDAPASPETPAFTAPVLLSATVTEGRLTLELSSTAPLGPLQIAGCRPLIAGQAVRPAHAFTGLNAAVGSPFALGEAYARKFGAVRAGQKIILRVRAVSENGFRGAPLLACATVGT